MQALRKEAARTREFLASSAQRKNRKGEELKTNVTDPESAKMATSKGVIQGYAAQAAVDSAHQIIVAADVIGSGSEQAMLLPMIEQSQAYREARTLITADAGYHSDANVQHLKDHNIPALIADNQMRSRDERFESQANYKRKPDPLSEKKATGQPKEVKRFGPEDFEFNDDNTATCPAGNVMTSSGNIHKLASGLHYQTYTAKAADCDACPLNKQCLKGSLKPNDGRGRKVTRCEPRIKDPAHPSERMRQAIDSPRGRQLYSQRIGTVEPVFGNIRHNKRLTRLNHRGRAKVNTQWNLYCMVHNIEKLANSGYAR
jgi:IS5 family transposase